jgi:hypothetical protein
MRAALLSLALLTPLPALAQCPGEVLFSCPIKAKTLEVCLTGGTAIYSFGPKGAPDLTITTPVADLAYQPWPGIGRTIWDSVRFHNDGVDYEVWAALDKMMEEGQPEPDWQGGVTVTRGDEILAELACTAPPDPPWLDQLFAAKEAAGQCWNFDSQSWQTAPCP